MHTGPYKRRRLLRRLKRIALLANGSLNMVGTPSEFLQAQTPEAKTFLACLDPQVEA